MTVEGIRRGASFPMLWVLLLLLRRGEVWAQRPLNLDFAIPSVSYPDRPWGWSTGFSSFSPGATATFSIDSTVRAGGRPTLRVWASDSGGTPAPRVLALHLPAEFARGRRVTLEGAVAARPLAGRALAQLQAWGDRVVPAADSAMVEAATAPGAFTPFRLTIDVPGDSGIHTVYVALGVAGSGTAWFGRLTLQVDGRAVTSIPTERRPPSAAQRRWLASRSSPLWRVAPPHDARVADDGDLSRFAAIVGDARVVGLGESTHGTREFFQLKHRLLEYLVRRHGFTLFAIEANQLAVERLNAYVLGGAGTAREAMRVLFRVWNTEEVLALVEWMRRYNDGGPARPLRIVGYDMQDHRLPADSLLALVGRVDPGFGDRVRALSSDFRAQPSFAVPQLPEGVRIARQMHADTLWREVTARRGTWLAAARTAGDSLAIAWGVQNANLLRQAAFLGRTLNSPDRDSLMAANLDWALRTLYPGARAVVWAHDVHVSHGGDRMRSFNAGAQMGAYLEHTFGYAYRAFSLLTQRGHYSATRSFTDHTIIAARAFPAPAGSVEALLAAIPRPRGSVGVLTDLRVREDDPAGRWLWQPRLIRHVGYAAYDYAFDLRAVMPLEFDGVILIDETTPSRVF